MYIIHTFVSFIGGLRGVVRVAFWRRVRRFVAQIGGSVWFGMRERMRGIWEKGVSAAVTVMMLVTSVPLSSLMPQVVYAAAGDAVLTGAPTGSSNVTSLTVTVGSDNSVTHYKHKTVAAADCSGVSWSSITAVTQATAITDDISSLADGTVTLCVAGSTDNSTFDTTNPTTASWTKDTAAPTAAYSVSDIGGTSADSKRYLNENDTVSVRMTFSESVAVAPTVQFKNDSTNLGSAVTASAITAYDTGNLSTSTSQVRSSANAVYWNAYSSADNVITKEASFGGTIVETVGDFATLRFRTVIPSEGNSQSLFYKDGSDPTSRTDGTEVSQSVSWDIHTFYGDVTINNVPKGRRFWWGNNLANDITLGSRTLRISGTYAANSYRATYTVGSSDTVANDDLKYDITNESSLTDSAGNEFAAHAATTITNYVVDTTAPSISSGEYGGTSIGLTMSEKVYAAPLPTPTDFKIKNDSSDIAVSVASVAPNPATASTAVNLTVPSTTWVPLLNLFIRKAPTAYTISPATRWRP